MSKLYKELSIIMVSYYSSDMINRCLSSIPDNISIIIVNNAVKDNLKLKIKRSKNIKIYTPRKNLGNGGGFNYGLNKSNCKFSMYLDVDTSINKKTLNKLKTIEKREKEGGINATNIKNYN